MPTIQDVARRAGVAPITASRVINNSGYFSEDIRQRVEAAVAELGYVPNSLARSLRSKRTHTLALVLSDITNPFFTTLARGVEDTASRAGYTVIFCNTDESAAKEQMYLNLLIQKQVDGILLVPSSSAPESIQFIQKHNTPVVVLDRRVAGIDVDTVRADSEAGAYRLVRLLIELRHRCIAILNGPPELSTAVDRFAGYRRALAEAGIELDGSLVFQGAFRQESGYRMAQQSLALQPRPTALFASNNFIGIGAMHALRDAGLRVPEDLALVGFDDLPQAMVIFPFLTVASQPAYDMGQRATELLLARLNGSLSQGCQEIILPIELVIRQSSGLQR